MFFHADGAPKSVREVYEWALRQPGAEAPVRAAEAPAATSAISPAVTAQSARATVMTAQSEEVRMLLASVMNWQPKHSPFSSLFGSNADATPSSAMSFGPGLLGLLSDSRDPAS